MISVQLESMCQVERKKTEDNSVLRRTQRVNGTKIHDVSNESLLFELPGNGLGVVYEPHGLGQGSKFESESIILNDNSKYSPQ